MEIMCVQRSCQMKKFTRSCWRNPGFYRLALCNLRVCFLKLKRFTKQTFVLLCVEALVFPGRGLCACVEILWWTAVRSALSRVCGKTEECWNFCRLKSDEFSRNSSSSLFSAQRTSTASARVLRIPQPSDMDCDNDCSTFELKRKICGSVPRSCVFSKPHTNSV